MNKLWIFYSISLFGINIAGFLFELLYIYKTLNIDGEISQIYKDISQKKNFMNYFCSNCIKIKQNQKLWTLKDQNHFDHRSSKVGSDRWNAILLNLFLASNDRT